MMDSNIERSTNPLPVQTESAENLRLAVLQPLLNVLAVVGTVSLVYNVILYAPKKDWLSVGVYFLLFVAMIISAFARRMPYKGRVVLIGSALFALGAFTFVLYGLNKNGVVFLLGFAFIFGILLYRRDGIIALVINGLLISVVGAAYLTGMLSGMVNELTIIGTVSQWVNTLISTSLIGVMMVAAGSTMISRLEASIVHQRQLATELEKERIELESTVEQRTRDLNRRATQLEAASHVAREISLFDDLDSLLNDTIELIRDQFGFYHAGLFLVDEENEFALLRAATGEAGRRMLARNHRLRIGEEGIVGAAIQKNEPRIALNVGKDAAHFKNPDLPGTRSEMALPLRSGGKVIGALDIQSEQESAFVIDDIRVLETIADQLALAIEKVSLLTQLKESLSEIEASYQQYTRKAWHAHLQNARRNYAFRYRHQHIEAIDEGYVEVEKALQAKQPVISHRMSEKQSQTLVAIPIKLRGETLGVINLRFDTQYVPQDTIDLLDNTANRLAMALENARLLEELQQRAERERQIGTIVSKVRSHADIDSILRTTAEELGRSLGVAEVLVQLKD